MWMYNGIFPGPLFEVESWQKIHVEISNNLPIDDGNNPESPLLPINDTATSMYFSIFFLLIRGVLIIYLLHKM